MKNAAALGLVFLAFTQTVHAKQSTCPVQIDGSASRPLSQPSPLHGNECQVRISHGYPIPDPHCTPGAVNPQITREVLKTKGFTTRKCERNFATTVKEKEATYRYYGVRKPSHNSGRNEVCELDHLVSLELGGADTMDNIWPQCGPDRVTLQSRYFKIKDKVEGYLARQVKAGTMSLEQAQAGIASDWTQYIDAATRHSARERKHR